MRELSWAQLLHPGGSNIWEHNPNICIKGFGVTSDTDTDELIGEEIWLQVGVETIQSGQRKGDLTNTIQEMIRPVEYDDDGEAVSGTGEEVADAVEDDEAME